MRHLFLTILWLARLGLVLGVFSFSMVSCKCAKDKEETAEETSEEVAAPSIEETKNTHGLGLVRLTPEQVSNAIYKALGQRLTAPISYGLTVDIIKEAYAVPLGGIDHDTVLIREFAAQSQTPLVIRTLAWQAAVAVVTAEAKGQAHFAFTSCNVNSDSPGGAGDLAWRAQIDDFYWRLFGRAPLAEEVDASIAAFNTIHSNEGSTAHAWAGILYAMLSSAEFWHL